MKKFGLIGSGISYSKSPKLHEVLAKKYHRDVQYDLIDIREEQLKHYIEALRKKEYDGYNVTIPYKEKVMIYLDEITSKAKRIGAVNTIYMQDQKVIGDNTDYDGFKTLFLSAEIPKNHTFIILGTGGASKAVSAVFEDLNIKFQIVSRKSKQGFIAYEDLKAHLYDGIIQTTPLGSKQFVNQSPLVHSLVEDKWVIDLIYEPSITKIMSYTNKDKAVNGLVMLIAQAHASQNIWFNENESLVNISKIAEEIK